MRYKVKQVETEIEKLIATAFVVSDEFLHHVRKIYESEFIENQFLGLIIDGAVAYYDKIGKAPGPFIDVEVEKTKEFLDDKDYRIVTGLLHMIERGFDEETFNLEYVKRVAMDRFKLRKAALLKQKFERIIESGDADGFDEAVESWEKFQAKTQSSGFFSIGDPKVFDEVFNDELYTLVEMPGAFGDMLGPLERGWSVAVLGPRKRGKTYIAQEIGIQSLMQGKKVVFINLEMSKQALTKRIYQRLIAFSKKETDLLYPVFDCYKNQTGSCKKQKKIPSPPLYNPDESDKPVYNDTINYTPCAVCRGTKDYRQDIWHERIEVKAMDKQKLRKLFFSDKGKKSFGLDAAIPLNNFRVRIYPKFQANTRDIKRDLDSLVHEEGFVPDVLIIDYPNIMKAEDARVTGRDRLDETWKAVCALAIELDCLVIAPAQTNRKSAEKARMDENDISDDIRIIGHVDAAIAINRTKEEEKIGIMRLSVPIHRHKEASEGEVILLQQPKTGQTLIDCEYKNWEHDES